MVSFSDGEYSEVLIFDSVGGLFSGGEMFGKNAIGDRVRLDSPVVGCCSEGQIDSGRFFLVDPPFAARSLFPVAQFFRPDSLFRFGSLSSADPFFPADPAFAVGSPCPVDSLLPVGQIFPADPPYPPGPLRLVVLGFPVDAVAPESACFLADWPFPCDALYSAGAAFPLGPLSQAAGVWALGQSARRGLI